MQRAWNKYGEPAFSCALLEFVPDIERLLIREQYWIDAMCSFDPSRGFNVARKAGSRFGVKQSESAKAKVSKHFKGKPLALEHREKIAKTLRGKKHPPDRIAKMIGKKRTPEQCAKLSAIVKAQWEVKLAERLASGNPSRTQRAAMPKKKRTVSIEQRARISVALTGRKRSPEAIERGRIALKGIPRTPEWKEAISTSITVWHAKRKAMSSSS